MVESFLKGGILLFSKEAIIRFSKGTGMGDTASGLLGGFGGGIAQVFSCINLKILLVLKH